jgi:ribosomal protein L21E
LGNTEGFRPDKEIDYKLDPSITSFEPNIAYLDGIWKNNKDNMQLEGDEGKIVLTYYAKTINFVASGNGQNVTISENNGSPKETNNHATDIGKDGRVVVDKQRLYNIGLYDDYKPRSAVIDVKGKGFQIYTFTFG